MAQQSWTTLDIITEQISTRQSLKQKHAYNYI